MRAALLMVGVLTGCPSPSPWDQAPRFAVMPYEADGVGGVLLAGVAWIPPEEGVNLPVTDAIAVPAIGEDFEWALETPPPESALRRCTEIGCLGEGSAPESAAVGWIVAFEDWDGDGTAELARPAGAPWSAGDVVATGPDVLVGLASDHAVAYAERTLDPTRGLAQLLGWPIAAGLTVMRVRRADRKDLLEPVASRERVSIYLLSDPDGDPAQAGEEPGLCCETRTCDPRAVHCPTFQGQGVAVD